jgi:mono/diheme cytochrome c family protein/plastocyanin
MTAERAARLIVIGLAVGVPLAALMARWIGTDGVEIHGRMAETGGWTPGALTAKVGEPLHLQLTSDDVQHGFAVGQMDWPAVEVKPGEMTPTTLTFDRPGKYVFYCTRWCGLNHWRMRGTISVTGAGVEPAPEPPLYATLGIDLDAPHPADAVPAARPSAARGAESAALLPPSYLAVDYYHAQSPAQVWRAIRAEPLARDLSDEQVWDVVSYVWRSNATAQSIEQGASLYAANCAACHGESGRGDGVMAATLRQAQGRLASEPTAEVGHGRRSPVDFTDPTTMLGASPALLQGKIIRGGMGTGMPYWGPIFTEAQTWAIVNYLWTFQFEMEEQP